MSSFPWRPLAAADRRCLRTPLRKTAAIPADSLESTNAPAVVRGLAAPRVRRGALASSGVLALLAAGAFVPSASAGGAKLDLYTTNSASGDPISDITPLNKPDDPNDIPLVGDWDGNGKDEVGIYHPTTRQFVFNHRNTSDSASTVLLNGNWGDIPLVGRWNSALTADAIALYRPSTGKVYYPTTSDPYGPSNGVDFGGSPGDIPIAGDWDGDGIDTLGLFRPSTNASGGGLLYLKNSNTASWPFNATVQNLGAKPGDVPTVGDWNLDGKDTIGLFRPSANSGQTFLMSNSGNGIINPGVTYGNPGDIPTVGDWNGDKEETFAVFRPSNHTFYMRQGNYTEPYSNAPDPFALTAFRMKPTDKPLYADWDGNGTDTPGYYRPETRELFYGNSTKAPTLNSFGPIGDPGDVVLVGRWTTATWRDQPALFRPSNDTFYYPSGSTAAINASYGLNHTPGDTILAADWNSDAVDTLGIWRSSERRLFIRNTNENISWQDQGTLGNPGDIPLVGHFRKGYATDTLALFRPSSTMYNVFYGANSTANFSAEASIPFGSPGDKPAIGDWDGDGLDTVGIQHSQMPRFGGDDGEVNTDADAKALVEAYRDASSDHIAATQVVGELWPAEVTYADDYFKRAAAPAGRLFRAAGTNEVWWFKNGQRHHITSADIATRLGVNLGETWRVSTGARDRFDLGEPIDATNVSSWRYGGDNGVVDTTAELSSLITAYEAASDDAAASIRTALRPADLERFIAALSSDGSFVASAPRTVSVGPSQEPTAADLQALGMTNQDVQTATAAGRRPDCNNIRQSVKLVQDLAVFPDAHYADATYDVRVCFNRVKNRVSYGYSGSTSASYFDINVRSRYTILGWRVTSQEATDQVNGSGTSQLSASRNFKLQQCANVKGVGLPACPRSFTGRVKMWAFPDKTSDIKVIPD